MGDEEMRKGESARNKDQLLLSIYLFTEKNINLAPTVCAMQDGGCWDE